MPKAECQTVLVPIVVSVLAGGGPAIFSSGSGSDVPLAEFAKGIRAGLRLCVLLPHQRDACCCGVRWFLGSAVLALPVLAVFSAPLWGSELPHVLPHDAELHLTIAWALGALIAYLADDHRRCVAVGQCYCCHLSHTDVSPTACCKCLH